MVCIQCSKEIRFLKPTLFFYIRAIYLTMRRTKGAKYSFVYVLYSVFCFTFVMQCLFTIIFCYLFFYFGSLSPKYKLCYIEEILKLKIKNNEMKFQFICFIYFYAQMKTKFPSHVATFKFLKPTIQYKTLKKIYIYLFKKS